MTKFRLHTHIIGKVYDLTQENMCAMIATIEELERQIERMNELYEQARTVCRYSGVDQFRFDNALRRLWETVGEIQKLKEQEE